MHPTKLLCESPTPQCNAIWRWAPLQVIRIRRDHEDEALVDVISFLIRRDIREPALSPPHKDTARMQPSASQEEGSHQKSKPAGFSDLRLSRLWNFEKKNLLFKQHSAVLWQAK